MGQGHDGTEAATSAASLTEDVLAELRMVRKRAEGLSPTGMAACPTMVALLGSGDPVVALSRLQARIVETLDQDDDVLPLWAATYSLGLASSRATHLDRLNDFGADYGFEARQARRYSDQGLRLLASLICASWVVHAVPVGEVFLTPQSDGGFVLTMRTKWQWFTDMQSPAIARQLSNGRAAPFRPRPAFTQPEELAASSGVRWLTSQLVHPLVLPAPQAGRETQVRIAWAGEMWPAFAVSVVGALPRGAMVTSTSLGDTVRVSMEVVA